MRSLAGGDTEALGVLYARYSRLIQSVIHRCWTQLPAEQVEDLSHEVFLAVHDAAPSYKEQGKLRSWLVSVALRTTRGLRRQTWRRSNTLANTVKVVDSSTRSPELQVSARMAVTKAVDALPEIQREVLFLHIAHDMSPDEIAAALGIKQNTVWTRLHRAREVMMRALADAVDTDAADDEAGGKKR